MSVQGKVAVITGGGSGLGKETCILFAKNKAKVVVADFDEEKAKSVASFIQNENGEAMFVKVDVSSKESVDLMVEQIKNTYGRVDILINNAGITKDARLVKMTENDFDQVIDVNLKGVFLCTNAIVPLMIEQKYGRIISTASISAYGNFGQTNYSASKAGVIAMTKTWSKELGKYGITANAVAPGFIRTPMTEAMRQDILENLEKQIPVGRLGEPKDIANAYLFLASEHASYINGSVLDVNGGLTL